MRIEKIETHKINLELVDFLTGEPRAFRASYGTMAETEQVFVKISTDEDIVGVGESMNQLISGPARTHLRPKETGETVTHIIHDLIAPRIVGDDPLEIDKIHHKMDGWVCGHMSAKAAIDMALYDIMGKFYKVPLCKLLAGSYRTEMKTLGGVGLGEPEQVAKDALSWIEKGFEGFQMKIGGIPFDPEKDVQRVRHVRDAVGDDAIIFTDANQSYSPRMAITTIKKMEKYDIYVEQPTPAYDIKALARVARAVNVPIAADESLSYGGTPIRNLVEIIENNAADVLMLKSMPIGGIQNQMDVIRVAEKFGLQVMMNQDGPVGRLGTTAQAQVGAAMNDRVFFDHQLLIAFMMVRPDIVKSGGLQLEKGTLRLPDGPGLGLEIDGELLTKSSVTRATKVTDC